MNSKQISKLSDKHYIVESISLLAIQGDGRLDKMLKNQKYLDSKCHGNTYVPNYPGLFASSENMQKLYVTNNSRHFVNCFRATRQNRSTSF